MFVKQAYERRLKKQQEQIAKLNPLKKAKSPKIGSVRNDKINYDKQEQFFSKQDIPQHARTIKQQIHNFIDPDHLGLRKKQWNTSVSVPKNFQKQQTHDQKLLKIKLGFLDHPEPKYKQPKIYDGTDTRNDFTGWNVSNEVLNREIKQNLQKTNQKAFQNTKMKQEQLLKTYSNPLSKTTTFIQTAKMKIQSEAQLRQRLRQQYLFYNPNASEQKTRAAVHRLAYQTEAKQKRDSIAAQAMRTDFKANLSLTQKSKISIQWTHTGIWQKFGREEEQNWGWSCCMNQEKDSRGCNYRVKDGNSWNLTSFNNN